MKTKFTHALTLRIDTTINELLTEAVWERQTSKAQFIRAAIRQRLGREHDGDMAIRRAPTVAGEK